MLSKLSLLLKYKERYHYNGGFVKKKIGATEVPHGEGIRDNTIMTRDQEVDINISSLFCNCLLGTCLIINTF